MWLAPLTGLGLGALAGLLFVLPLGLPAAATLGTVTGLGFALGLAHTAWRSAYGSAQGLLSSALLLVMLLVLAAGMAGVAVSIGRGAARGTAWPWMLLAAACVAWAAMLSTRRELRALREQGALHPWWRQAVDWQRGRVSSMDFSAGVLVHRDIEQLHALRRWR